MTRLGFDKLLLVALFVSSCATGRTVYKKPGINLSVVKQDVIEKKKGIIIRYFVRPGVMFEQTGYLHLSEKENCVVFQYYDNDEKKFVELELPIQNISEISYENHMDYETKTRLIGVTTLLVAGLVVLGISI
ncbi:MAG: hypothetical protein KDC45_01095 [Bacteroidetes bacterium]|nr:hypothetical protein [Bacteroidota bacterium]